MRRFFPQHASLLIQNSEGSAILAVLITSSIVGALAYMTLFSLSSQQQSTSRVFASSEFQDIVYEVQTALRAPESCIKAASTYAAGNSNIPSMGYLADSPAGAAIQPLGFSPGRTFRSIRTPVITLGGMTNNEVVSYGLRSYITTLRLQATPTAAYASNLPFSSMLQVYWSLKIDGSLESCKLARISSDGRTIEERICATRFSTPTNYYTYDPLANNCVSKVCPPGKTITNYKMGTCG